MTIQVAAFRSLLAVLVGLVIGIERSRHGRAAGMRTHILVCLGSAMTAMTGIYIHETFGTGDVFRLSAQVISGVGFLGAGMIILKNDNVIMGLTTAAGVWATSTVGIALGYGFYTGALIVAVLFPITLILFAKFERRKKNTEVLYLELDDMSRLNEILSELRELVPGEAMFRVMAPKSCCVGHIGLEMVVDRRKNISIESLLQVKNVIFAIEV
ncbi:MAG: MgtC/SapB family protein [Clostridia bacterium]|nr:MgtC/SapB family protein [Clostridia bacterium]